MIGEKIIVLTVLSTLLLGCGRVVSTTSNDSRPMPSAPNRGPVTPKSARANAITIQVTPKPRDTDGNGYPDLIDISANLFSQPYPMPIYEEGTFVFILYLGGQSNLEGATPIAQWKIESETAKRGKTLYGLTYFLQLSLLETSGDTFPLIAADLVCIFEPADGRPPIRRQEIHKLQIGKLKSRI